MVLYSNCFTCNDTLCLSCQEESVFINDNYSKCELISLLDMNDYFTNDNITYYYCKDDRYKDREECTTIISQNSEIDISTNSINIKSTQYESEIPDLIKNSTDISINTINDISSDYSTEISIKTTIINSTEDSIETTIISNSTDFIDNTTNEISMSSQLYNHTEFPSQITINSTTDINILNESTIKTVTLLNITSTEISINPNDYNSSEETNITSLNIISNENTSELTSLNIKIPSEFQTEKPTSKTVINNPFYQLIILQVRIIKNLLKIFIIISTKIKNPSIFKISIDLYKSGNSRNLQETSLKNHQVDLYLNENNELEPGKIYELTSQEEFNNSDRVVVNIKSNSDYEIKLLNNNNKVLDYQENEKMIKNR